MFDVIAFGPFVGDWRCETFIFRPFIKWVSETINIDNICVSSHTNRLFLYDWVKEENRIPIYEDISRDEISQNGFLHRNVNKSDFNLFNRLYKDELSKRYKEYINYFPINYTRFFQYPMYCRLFTKIYINDIKRNKDKYILYIPDDIENVQITEDIYNLMLKNIDYKIIICGDMKTHLNKYNTVLSKKDYFENGYKNIISYINNAIAVICPMGLWTFIANLQCKPVYSWIAKDSSIVYRNMFINDKYNIIQSRNPKDIVTGFNMFLKKEV